MHLTTNLQMIQKWEKGYEKLSKEYTRLFILVMLYLITNNPSFSFVADLSNRLRGCFSNIEQDWLSNRSNFNNLVRGHVGSFSTTRQPFEGFLGTFSGETNTRNTFVKFLESLRTVNRYFPALSFAKRHKKWCKSPEPL